MEAGKIQKQGDLTETHGELLVLKPLGLVSGLTGLRKNRPDPAQPSQSSHLHARYARGPILAINAWRTLYRKKVQGDS